MGFFSDLWDQVVSATDQVLEVVGIDVITTDDEARQAERPRVELPYMKGKPKEEQLQELRRIKAAHPRYKDASWGEFIAAANRSAQYQMDEGVLAGAQNYDYYASGDQSYREQYVNARKAAGPVNLLGG